MPVLTAAQRTRLRAAAKDVPQECVGLENKDPAQVLLTLYNGAAVIPGYTGKTATLADVKTYMARGHQRIGRFFGRVMQIRLLGQMLDVTAYNAAYGHQAAQTLLAKAPHKQPHVAPKPMGGPSALPFVPKLPSARLSPRPTRMPSPALYLAAPARGPMPLPHPKALWLNPDLWPPHALFAHRGSSSLIHFPHAQQLATQLAHVSEGTWYQDTLCPMLMKAAGQAMTVCAFTNFLFIALSSANDIPHKAHPNFNTDNAHTLLADAMLHDIPARAAVHAHFAALAQYDAAHARMAGV